MAIPTSGYPTTLDDTNATPSATVEFPQPASSTDLDATNVEHDLLHKNLSLAIVALQTKLGITDSNATSGTLLQGTGAGSSSWSSTLPAVTLGGAVTGGDQIMSTVTHKDYSETVYAGGNTGTSQTLAETNGNVQTWTMNGNCTFTMPSGSGLQAGTSLTLILTQDGTGSRTGAFTGVKWAGGSAPTLTTTATTGIDVLTFITFNGGASPVWYGFVAGAAMA
tara:strand:- start:1132 stop:1797 length:666 start_codon:yes stop_codon:yes gene_type:complete